MSASTSWASTRRSWRPPSPAVAPTGSGAPTVWHDGPEGVPVLDGVLAWLVCRVAARVPAGDHRIVLAEVVLGDHAGTGRPLLYHQGRFNGLRD